MFDFKVSSPPHRYVSWTVSEDCLSKLCYPYAYKIFMADFHILFMFSLMHNLFEFRLWCDRFSTFCGS